MIRDLFVRNLVIVDRAALSLHEGLIAITGETGAGKSVLLGSLELACGGRASTDLIRPREDEASVSAIFTLEGSETEVHRSLTRQGKHKVSLNGENSSLQALRQRLDGAVAIHTQSETRSLADPASHRTLLDRALEDKSVLRQTAEDFASLRQARQALLEHEQKAASRKERLDWLLFQIRNLEPFAMPAEEYADSLERAKRLQHSELITETIESSLQVLQEEDNNAASLLGRASTLLGNLSKQVDSFAPLAEEAQQLDGLLADLIRDLQSLHRETDEDGNTDALQELEERIEGIQRYARDQQIAPKDQWEYLDNLRAERETLSDFPAATRKLEEDEARALQQYEGSAARLSEARQRAASILEEQIVPLLGSLALPDARLQFSIRQIEPGALGSDEVELLFASSADLPLRPLHKVASGGELSRVLLGLKVLESRHRSPHTMIFDEIDAGVGGQTAYAIADVLAELSRRHQVIAITHLPQVAARADQHFSVQKVTIDGRTIARIVVVDGDARLRELSRMLGGDTDPEGLRLAQKLIQKASSGD